LAYQVTYVIGVRDPIERAACVSKVLKTVCGIDASWLRAHPEAPRLADSGIKIVPEPRDTDIWHDLPALLRLQRATEPEYLCALAAERAVREGKRLVTPVLKSIDDEQTRFTVTTDLFDGDQERDLSHIILAHMLVGLTELDGLCLRRHPKWPGIYDGHVRYEEEPVGQEDWADIPTAVELGTADCFPEGTLLLRDDFELIPIEEICVGDRIWGRDAWTTVEAVADKGNLSIDGVRLNNGDVVTLTGDHHFFVGRCTKHAPHLDDGYGCSCPLESRTIEKVRLRDLQPKNVLTQPKRIAFGSDDSVSPERMYVEGLYISDGWHQSYKGQPTRFAISGQDGCPKEEQKREVQRIADALGYGTRWHRKYIAINDREWSERVVLMGGHAPEKHALSLNLPEAQAKQLLRGIMADSKVNDSSGWTFTTTSHQLMVQTRVLHKMFGRNASAMYITKHGGLGKNPIWRLRIREPRGKSDKLLRVKSIERDIAERPCYDIQTSDHYVYLPEHDVTVSNCEDLACWRAAELNVRHGIKAYPTFVWRRRPNGSYLYHIITARPDMARPGQEIPTEDPSRHLGME
jgi:hypothetical protein